MPLDVVDVDGDDDNVDDGDDDDDQCDCDFADFFINRGQRKVGMGEFQDDDWRKLRLMMS